MEIVACVTPVGRKKGSKAINKLTVDADLGAGGGSAVLHVCQTTGPPFFAGVAGTS